MTFAQANSRIASFIKSQNSSDLLRVTAIFDKVPMGVPLGLDVKVGSQGGQSVRTSIRVNATCFIWVDRSNSGDTLGNNTNFVNTTPKQTEFDCERETNVKIEVLIDRSSVEVFFFDWYSMTELVFTDVNNRGVELWTGLNEDYIRPKFVKLEVLQKTMFDTIPKAIPAEMIQAEL